MPTAHVNPVLSNIPPFAVQQRIGTTAARYALNTMLMPRTDSGLTYIDYRSGVMASGDGGTTHLAMQVNAGSGMSVTVNQGNCVINTSGQGAYMCCLDHQVSITIPASSSTTNRIDVIVACVYDDNNTVLASPAGTRQFSIEVLQGDGVTGTPTAPQLSPGMIPLANVLVSAGVSAITQANITDMRGPGIVARGGMRGLYGADSKPGSSAFTAPGAYPGDQRWVHNSVFQHQVYYGSSMGWRGVNNCLVYTANPPSGSFNWHFGVGNIVTLCSVTIPDPGTPYMVYPTGRSHFQLSPGTAVDLRITFDSPSGTAISWARNDSGGATGTTEWVYNVAPIMWGDVTGSHKIYLTGMVFATNSGGGFGYGGNDLANLLSVNVYPSTVQPPTQ